VSRRRAALIAALVTGVSAVLLTVALAVCGLGLTLVQRRSSPSTAALPIVSVVAVGIALGLLLAWQAVAGLSGKPSRQLGLPLAGGTALVALYVLAVAGGQAVVSSPSFPLLALTPFHILALALPPLLLLWSAASLVRDTQFTWRQSWGGLGGGAFGAAGLAFLIEATLLVVGVMIVMSVLAASPGGLEKFRSLRPTLGGAADPVLVRSLLRNPVVIAGLLLSVSVVVPLIEEPAKSLAPQRLFLWGAAGGAGFALLEGVVNGGLNTEQWGLVVLLRVGSSAMHCFATGLTGWGWGEALARRRWLRLALAYAAAVVIHGVWNAVSIGMAVASEGLDPGALQNALVAASIGLLALLTLGAMIALMTMAKRLSVQGAASEV
jgi:hypothetical protein